MTLQRKLQKIIEKDEKYNKSKKKSLLIWFNANVSFSIFADDSEPTWTFYERTEGVRKRDSLAGCTSGIPKLDAQLPALLDAKVRSTWLQAILSVVGQQQVSASSITTI